MRPDELKPLLTAVEDENRRLREALFSARLTIINLMSDEAQRLLNSYYECASTAETRPWLYRTAEAVIKLAETKTAQPSGYFPDRAYCPLCRAGSSSPYAEGFTVPEGLHRHLVGWGSHRCEVMRVVSELANEHWRSKFAAADAKAEEEAQAARQARRQTETLYRLGPTDDPKLIDESLGYGVSSRTVDDLSWAEERLSSLGFTRVADGSAVSYTEDLERAVVYADPRGHGEIQFMVYRAAGIRRRKYTPESFAIKDSWKNDLVKKYRMRRDEAITALFR